jgi:hypothetical protein
MAMPEATIKGRLPKGNGGNKKSWPQPALEVRIVAAFGLIPEKTMLGS